MTEAIDNVADHRGERLFPSRSSRIYWHLTSLRLAYERALTSHVSHAPGNMIDFGCGNMPYRRLFEPVVSKYTGYDLAGNTLAEGVITPEGKLPLADGSVDFVLSSQVLEHVPDPDQYLSEARRVLRLGGKLLLSTHGTWHYHPDPTDFWRWTCDGLRQVIVRNGFEVISFEGVMGPAATAIQLWQDAAQSRLPTFLHSAFFWLTQKIITRVDLKCKNAARDSDACVYVVVATPRN